MSQFWIVLATVMSVWALVATYVNAKNKAPTAPKWKVIVWHVIVDTPALYASIGKAGIFGKFNLPGLPSFHVEETQIGPGPTITKVSALLPLLLLPTLLGGCAGVAAQAKAAGISEATQVFRDIGTDAPAVGSCVFKTAATAAAITAGDWAAIATGAIDDIACFYEACKLIAQQLQAPNAAPPPKAVVATAKATNALIRAALTVTK